MLVHGPSRICTHPSSIPIDTFAFVFTGGKSSGCEKAAGPVTEFRGAVVAPEIFRSPANRNSVPARATASARPNKFLTLISVRNYNYTEWLTYCGRGTGVGRARGVGVTLGPGVYWIDSIGGLALSRVSNRFAVAIAVSSPNTSQPKLLAGLSSHSCTSATIWAEFHMYCPTPPTD